MKTVKCDKCHGKGTLRKPLTLEANDTCGYTGCHQLAAIADNYGRKLCASHFREEAGRWTEMLLAYAAEERQR